jgi:hypothetical protein
MYVQLASSTQEISKACKGKNYTENNDMCTIRMKSQEGHKVRRAPFILWIINQTLCTLFLGLKHLVLSIKGVSQADGRGGGGGTSHKRQYIIFINYLQVHSWLRLLVWHITKEQFNTNVGFKSRSLAKEYVINCWRSLGTALGTQRTAQTTLVGNI